MERFLDLDKSVFTYLGKRYKPVKQLKGRACSFNYISRNTDNSYTGTPDGYTHADFYVAASKLGCGTIDIFQCLEDGKILIPCGGKLFLWIGKI